MRILKYFIIFFLGIFFGVFAYMAAEKNKIPAKPAVAEVQVLDKDIIKWGAMAASEALTFNYDNNKEVLERAKRHFTEKGWSEFDAELKKERIIESVEANFQLTRANLHSIPQILSKDPENESNLWVMNIPLRVSFMVQHRSRNSNFNAILTIVRADKDKYENGFAIDGWEGMPR